MQIAATFIPKCRRKTLYGQWRQHLGEVFKRLAEQKVEPDSSKAIYDLIMFTS